MNIQTVPDPASKKDIIVGVGVAVNRKFEVNSSPTQDGLFHDHFIRIANINVLTTHISLKGLLLISPVPVGSFSAEQGSRLRLAIRFG